MKAKYFEDPRVSTMEAKIRRYENLLGPLSDANPLVGLSTEGMHLVGDDASIKWVKNHIHRSKQLEEYRDEFLNRIKDLEAKIATLS